jgi:hypothetical protein
MPTISDIARPFSMSLARNLCAMWRGSPGMSASGMHASIDWFGGIRLEGFFAAKQEKSKSGSLT